MRALIGVLHHPARPCVNARHKVRLVRRQCLLEALQAGLALLHVTSLSIQELGERLLTHLFLGLLLTCDVALSLLPATSRHRSPFSYAIILDTLLQLIDHLANGMPILLLNHVALMN